jgi:uncharacterized protein with GYD domain
LPAALPTPEKKHAMSIHMIQGNYTLDAVRGMLAKPSDRAATVRPLIEIAGERCCPTTSPRGLFDIQILIESDESEGLMPP